MHRQNSGAEKNIWHLKTNQEVNFDQWQRWMHRTRALDEHLKDLFMDGVKTPDGSQFGGKGFRSTWQEGVVACATSMARAIDLGEDSIADADVVAPMIRDVGLALSMGQTPLEISRFNMSILGFSTSKSYSSLLIFVVTDF